MKKSKKPKIPKEIEKLSEELSGGYWNTRIIRKYVDGKYKNGKEYHEVYMGVYEVYYKADDSIWAWSENPISPTFEDKEGFGEVLGQLLKASDRPILELKNGELIETNELLIEKTKGEQDVSE